LLKKNFAEDFEVIVKEVSRPESSARIMADHVTQQLEKRMPYRRVIKTVIEKAMAKGAK
jgi:small subunit ribosomal protein S3